MLSGIGISNLKGKSLVSKDVSSLTLFTTSTPSVCVSSLPTVPVSDKEQSENVSSPIRNVISLSN